MSTEDVAPEPLASDITRAELAAERDEIQKRIAAAILVTAEQNAPIRAPIIVLQGDKCNPYPVIEKHLIPEVLAGCERFWRLARSLHKPMLDTWRPRVNGIQLKALQGVRLPDSDGEWGAVQAELEALRPAFKPASSPRAMLHDLVALRDDCAAWWDFRNRPSSAGAKRPPSRANSASSLAQKRQHVSSPPPSATPPHGAHASHSRGSEGYHQPFSGPDMLQQQQHFMWQQSSPFGMPLLPLPGINSLLNSMMVSPDDSFAGLGNQPLSFMQRSDSGSGSAGGSQPTFQQHLPPLRQLQHSQPQQQAAPTPETVPPLHLRTVFSSADFSSPPSSSHDKLPARSVVHTPDQAAPNCIPTSKQQQVMSILKELEQRIISLNVGGTHVTTTAATLAAVEGSFLWKLVFIQPAAASPRAQRGDFFIDRDGKVFETVMAYLRALHYREPEPELPPSASDLALLVREANFYALPGLAARAQEALDWMSESPPKPKLAIDIRIDDQGRGTVARCQLETDLPAFLHT